MERAQPAPFDVVAYLKQARGQTIPPFLLELVLKSGRTYFIKNVFDHFDGSGLFAIRVWDLRALTESDSVSLLAKLNETKDREAWSDYAKFAPKLDQANLWLRAQDIDHIVEWHDRFWPNSEAASDKLPPVIGFRHPGGRV